jgi:hypothetical protein
MRRGLAEAVEVEEGWAASLAVAPDEQLSAVR